MESGAEEWTFSVFSASSPDAGRVADIRWCGGIAAKGRFIGTVRFRLPGRVFPAIRGGRFFHFRTQRIKVAGLAAVFALVKPGLLDDIASFHQFVQRPLDRRDAIAALGGYGLDGRKTLALLVTMQNKDLKH